MIKLLDHGYLQLVDNMGTDLSIVRSARVSYDGKGTSTDEKLINYLMKNGHNTPFESCVVTFEIKAPIFVVRQWHRHRTQCLAGSQEVIFNRPCNNKAYRTTMKELYDKWYHPLPKRKRKSKTYRDIQRERIAEMGIRSSGGKSEHVVDVISKGENQIYEVFTKYGSVKCTDNHRFKTENGESTISKGLDEVRVVIQTGLKSEEDLREPVFNQGEIYDEIWEEYKDGYDVSNLGRVRSWFRQGSQYKHKEPMFKKITTNNSKRAVVNIDGEVLQVSRMVAECFIQELMDEDLVLHKNDRPLDNRLDNLYVGDHQDNSNDRIRNDNQTRLREITTPVLGIKKLGVEETYDLSVTGDHWFCADNILVHNSYNEISARYTELPAEFYVPELEQITTQCKDNKQMRSEYVNEHAVEIRHMINECNLHSFQKYTQLLEAGTPRELARSVLPVGTYTKFFATANLHNWFKFIGERSHPHAQYEIRVYSDAILEVLKELYPVATQAFINTRS